MDGMSEIHSTAIIYPGVRIEENVRIGPYCVIGGPPEHREFYDGKKAQGVIIKAGARIFSHVTIDAGTNKPTIIGKNVAIFNHSHVGHDCYLDHDCIIGGSVSLAGHCHVMPFANISGKSCLSQQTIVGAYAFLGGASYLTRDLPIGERWVGQPPRYMGENIVGLGRAGIDYDVALLEYGEIFQELKRERDAR